LAEFFIILEAKKAGESTTPASLPSYGDLRTDNFKSSSSTKSYGGF
jgi:hypothetical protein